MVCRVRYCVLANLRKMPGCLVCSAVQYCVLYRPNCARLRKWVLALMSDRGPLRPLWGSAFGFGQPDRFATGAFLDNHEIAFGVVHFALCPFPRSCAQRWGRYSPRLHGRVGGTSAHPHSASDSSFGVVLRIQTHMRPHGLGRNTSLKPCATPLHPSAQSRLSPESPAPWLMHLVRPRYMSCIPFPCCGASAPYSHAKRGYEQYQSFGLYLAQIISWCSESELPNTERRSAERQNADRQ